MTEKIIRLLEENWKRLPVKDSIIDRRHIYITKMCQRIVGHDTKVLFLITYKKTFVCVVKIMRDISFNEKLKKEKVSQEALTNAGISSVPQVYFEGMIDEQYVYGEEVVGGRLISKSFARKKEREIIDIIRSFPVDGAVSTVEVARIFSEHVPANDKSLQALLGILFQKDLFLKKGLTHSDLGRPNVLQSSGKLYIIDWERAGDRPFWLIDAVYFMVKLRSVRTLEEWEKNAMSIFMQYTGVDRGVARALYCILKLYDVFHKKYPESYKKVIIQFSE